MSEVRTRFAPSPTGFMHVGGIRTALFAWAFARHQKGHFILRIEDTDKEREVAGSLEHIMESLRWLGLDWDEGPDQPGQYGPYVQSQRLDIYRQWAEELIVRGLAFIDPYSPSELDQLRRQAQQQNRPFLYRNYRPAQQQPPIGWYGKRPLRFLNQETASPTVWQDEVRGELRAGVEAQDDFVIIKADGYPTYNFAHVVDDYLMKISHVMRGEEFIASTPKFIALHNALGWPLPKFATLPVILGASGGKKLSKRDGAKDILQYRTEGYLPETMVNFLASLGWNDGTEDEVFTPEQIVSRFDIKRVQKAGARFDSQKLLWLSGHHIRRLDLKILYSKIPSEYWPTEASSYDDGYRLRVLALVQDRLKFFQELADLTIFFFKEPQISSAALLSELDQISGASLLEAVVSSLEKSDFSIADLETRLRQLAADQRIAAGTLFKLIRQAITGRREAPGLFETLNVLGSEVSLKRLQTARASL